MEKVYKNLGKKVKCEVKCEVVEEQIEDQPTVSGQNPIDFSAKTVSDSSRTRSERGRDMVDNFSDHFNDHSRVMARAAELQASLAPEFPSFWKLMKRSHVTKGFWLGLPSEFCQSYLPSCGPEVVLEDENGDEYNVNYLKERALSGGWRGFSIAQKLVEGDAVVFHLICRRVNPIKFKVYIVRATDFEPSNGLSLPNSVACENIQTCKKEKKKRPRLQSYDENVIHSLDTAEGCTSSGFVPDIKDFNIVVNGVTIDSLSTHVRTKYYHLCCNQESNIHEGLFNSNIAAGIISETVNIADAISASSISTSLDDLLMWDKTLEAFGMLGMKVQFLRNRLCSLLSILRESRERSKRYAEARTEREDVQREIKSLELKLLGIKQHKRELDDEMEKLEEKTQDSESLFQTQATAPW